MMISQRPKYNSDSTELFQEEKMKLKRMLVHEYSLSTFLKGYIQQDIWIKNINQENGLTYIMRHTNDPMDETDLLMLIDFMMINSPNLLVHLLNERTIHNDTCIMMSIYTDKKELTKKLIENDLVELNIVNSKKMTPLMLAILKDDHDTALTIVKSNRDYYPQFVSEVGYTPFMGVCFNGWSDMAHIMLDKGNCNLKAINKENKNAFLYAVIRDLDDICIRLIESGESQIDIIENVQNITPFFYAILRKNEKLAIRILETGRALPEFKTRENETTLMIACHYQMKELVHKLLDTGLMDLQCSSHLKYNAFIYTCQFEDMMDISLRILSMTPEPKYEGIMNPLLWTVYHENVPLTKYLIETEKLKYFDIDDDGDHPLIIAVRKKNQELVSYLLTFYTTEEVMTKNKEGKNAIDYSMEENDADIFDLLSEKVGYQYVMESL